MSQAPALSAELEEYAQLFFKYSVIIEEQINAVRHMPDEVSEAYAKVTEEHNEMHMHDPQRGEPTLEESQNVLKDFGPLCENTAPQTTLDRVRIVFYASLCAQTIVNGILTHSDRPGYTWSDSHTVLARGGQLLKEYLSGQPNEIPIMAPAIVKFTPPDPTTRPITDQDFADWRSHPEQLVEKCFISKDMVGRIFYIDDYSVGRRKGAQYEVLYEDLGLDELEVQTFDLETLLEILSEDNTELVTNPLPRSDWSEL